MYLECVESNDRAERGGGEGLTGDLTIGRHVPLPQEENQLLFGKLGIHLGKREHVECQVPGSILHSGEVREGGGGGGEVGRWGGEGWGRGET